MSVNYLQGDGKKVLQDFQYIACYSTIFNHGIEKNATEVVLYETDNAFSVDVKLIPDWVNKLNLCGFPCKYEGKGLERYKIANQYHVFVIDLKKYKYINHLASTMTMLRYMFEGDEFARGVTKFFEIKKDLKTISNFRTLLMSFAYFSGNNHACHSGSFRQKFITKKQLFDKFAKGNTIEQGGRDIQNSWEIGEPLNYFQVTDNFKKLYKCMEGKHKNKVYVVGGANHYANWLPNFEVTKNLEDADLVMFTGGEDVDPSLYGAAKHPMTGSNLARDLKEKELYNKAKGLELPCLGICRGSQFICVMNGGKLVQHQDNPHRVHEIVLYTGDKINITSTHHQAAYPFNMSSWNYKLLGWTNGISAFHEDGNEKELAPPKECEIVYYCNGGDLGIQGHPEFSDYQKDPNNQASLEALKDIFNKFINREL